MRSFIVLALCFAAVSAGPVQQEKFIGGDLSIETKGEVDFRGCGGVGTLLAVRIDGCAGSSCTVTPGVAARFEADIIPSSAAPSLTLKVVVIWNGIRIGVIDTVLENSTVRPGVKVTITFTIIPNDTLSGSKVDVEASIMHSDTKLVEACGLVLVLIG